MPSVSAVKANTIHITGREQFSAELGLLRDMTLSSPHSGEREQRILDGLKILGPRYVDTILAYSANRSAKNALAVYEVAKGVRTLIEQGHTANGSEAAFKNQAPIPDRGDQIKGYRTAYAGAVFNGIFATFAGSTFFEDYLAHHHNFERNDVKPDMNQLLKRTSLPAGRKSESA